MVMTIVAVVMTILASVFSDNVGSGATLKAARILHAGYREVPGERCLAFNAGTIEGGTVGVNYPEQNRCTTFGKTRIVSRTVVAHSCRLRDDDE